MYELTNETVAGRKYYARLELDDGTVLTNYGDEAVGIASISLSQTLCGSESVSIGCVNAASVTIVLETGTALENQRFTLYLGQEFDGAVEWVPMGVFTAVKAEFSEGKLTVDAWDDLYFAGGDYTPPDSVTGECTLMDALTNVCSQAGLPITIYIDSFGNQKISGIDVTGLTIAGMPAGLTCSAAIGHLAALCGANACMDREGFLVFRQFTATGQALGTDDCYSGGMVFKTSDFTVASLTNTLEVETTGDDGEATTETLEVERTTGAAGGCIALTNPLMTEDNIDTAWDVVKGFAYRPATLTAVGQLAVDVGDVLTVTDATGAVYSVPVMTHTLEYDGGLKSTLTAAGESESQQSAAVSGPVAQQIRELTTKVTDTKVLASGKSAVYYATTAPSAEDYTLSVNDLWFDTSGGDYAMYYWDGSAWVAAPFGTTALGDNVVTTAKIVAGAVTAEKLDVAEISAICANLGTITGGSLDIGGGTFTVDSEGNLTAKNANLTGSLYTEAYTYGELAGWTNISGGHIESMYEPRWSMNNGAYTYATDYTYCEQYGGTFTLRNYDCDTATGQDGALILHPGGIFGYYQNADTETEPGYWFSVINRKKTVAIDGALEVTGGATVGGFSIPEIQHGSTSVKITELGAITEFSVTYDTPFSGTPNVVFTPRHNSGVTSVEHKILTSSASGFTGYIKSSGGGTHVVEWIAMY
ncbi:MAG: hypothetical protein LUG58_03300 [Clostridiales bacterium]|nr:hypothetical protein [Clostridiales bacterium]